VPADHEHFNSFIAANTMSPIIAFLEPEVRAQIVVENLDARKPGMYLSEGRRLGLAVQSLN
jgi:hypothetical protein